MKNSRVFSYAVNLYKLMNPNKHKVLAELNISSKRIVLLEKANALDKKITQMFYNYLFSKIPICFCDTEETKEFELRTKIIMHEIMNDESQNSFDVKELVQDLYAYYGDYTETNNIEFSIDTNFSLLSLPISKEFFYQIVFSLIDNKLQFLGRGDMICLTLDQKGHELIISIQDSGFVLSAAQINKYAKKITERSNIFFLHWMEIVRVLEAYNYHYQVEHNNKGNYFKMELSLNNVNFANQNNKAIENANQKFK